MEEIKLNYTQEELSILLDALNHATIALGKIYAAARFSCEIPTVFEEKFKDMSFEEINEYTTTRFKSIQELYTYLLSFENNAGVV